MNWNSISFEYPWVLWGIVPWVLLALYLELMRKDAAGVLIGQFSQSLTRWTWRKILLQCIKFLPWLAGVCIIVAMAQPFQRSSEEKQKGEGIDIVLALDLSSSMLAKDFDPNRLEVAKKLAADFIQRRKYDRIGIVAFAGEAYTVSPLSTDKVMLQNFVLQLETGYLEDGTAIGMGLASAINRLKDSEVKSKIIILLTDGENNAGYISPQTALNIALDQKLKIYTIGVGTKGQAPAPYRRRGNDFIYRMTRVNIDEQLLTEMATKSGGQYFRAQNEKELAEIYDIIDQLERSEVELEVIIRKIPEFQWWTWMGLILLVIYILITFFIIKIIP